jgi:hypothetical protein
MVIVMKILNLTQLHSFTQMIFPSGSIATWASLSMLLALCDQFSEHSAYTKMNYVLGTAGLKPQSLKCG